MTGTTPSMRPPQPAVSVLMPVYNAEPFLAEAIESILGQTFRDFEFLILNDGSTDGSADTIATYAEQDDRIRFVSRENRGLSATLNEMADMARAPLLARMDADDISLPERFAKQVAFLEANPEIVAVGGQPLLCDVDMRPIHVPRMPTDHETIDANNIGGNISMPHPGTMMRADVLRDLGGYDDGAWFTEGRWYAEDLDLWLRMAEVGRLANLPEVIFRYRLSDASICGSNTLDHMLSCQAACRKAWKRRGLPEQPITFAEWRPDERRASRRNYTLSWGWRAWKAGNQDTARHLFLKAIRIDPLSVKAWKGLVFGTLRRPE